MLIKEYRIPMPFSIDEYRYVQRYAIARATADETSHGEGVTVNVNEPFDDQHGQGQYTEKDFHLGERIPGWLRAIMPSSLMTIEEKAWNSYPIRTYTCYTCPGFSADKFRFKIWSTYRVGNGIDGVEGGDNEGDPFDPKDWANSFPIDIDQGSLKSREVDRIDIAVEEVDAKHYREDQDPTLFVSKKYPDRGPFLPGWDGMTKPCMTAYKLCAVEFKYWGFQGKVERLIHNTALRAEFVKAHRKAVCWLDEVPMSNKGIRRYERRTKHELQCRIEGKDTPPPPDTDSEDDDNGNGNNSNNGGSVTDINGTRGGPGAGGRRNARGIENVDSNNSSPPSLIAARSVNLASRTRITNVADDDDDDDDDDNSYMNSNNNDNNNDDDDDAFFDAPEATNESFEGVQVWTSPDDVDAARAEVDLKRVAPRRVFSASETPSAVAFVLEIDMGGSPSDALPTSASTHVLQENLRSLGKKHAKAFVGIINNDNNINNNNDDRNDNDDDSNVKGNRALKVVPVQIDGILPMESAFREMAHSLVPCRNDLLQQVSHRPASDMPIMLSAESMATLVSRARVAINLAWERFRKEHPSFGKGSASIIAEGTAAVVAFDMISTLPPTTNSTGTANQPGSASLKKQRAATAVMHSLNFVVDHLVVLGSPLPLVLAARQGAIATRGGSSVPISSSSSKHAQARPLCMRVANVFFAHDPGAYRLEPLLDHRFRLVPPFEIVHHRREQRPVPTMGETAAEHEDVLDDIDAESTLSSVTYGSDDDDNDGEFEDVLTDDNRNNNFNNNDIESFSDVISVELPSDFDSDPFVSKGVGLAGARQGSNTALTADSADFRGGSSCPAGGDSELGRGTDAGDLMMMMGSMMDAPGSASRYWWGHHRIDCVLPTPPAADNLPAETLSLLSTSYLDSKDLAMFLLRILVPLPGRRPGVAFGSVDEGVDVSRLSIYSQGGEAAGSGDLLSSHGAMARGVSPGPWFDALVPGVCRSPIRFPTEVSVPRFMWLRKRTKLIPGTQNHRVIDIVAPPGVGVTLRAKIRYGTVDAHLSRETIVVYILEKKDTCPKRIIARDAKAIQQQRASASSGGSGNASSEVVALSCLRPYGVNGRPSDLHGNASRNVDGPRGDDDHDDEREQWTMLSTVKSTIRHEMSKKLSLDDRGGMAFLRIAKEEARPVGTYPIAFAVGGDGTYCTGGLHIIEKHTSIVLFEIDGAVAADVGSHSVRSGGKMTRAFRRGASECAWLYASKGYLIIYLCGRPDYHAPRVRQWLAQSHMPRGPVIFTATPQESANTRRRAKALAREIAAVVTDCTARISCAYVATGTACRALRAAGIDPRKTWVFNEKKGSEDVRRIRDTSYTREHIEWVRKEVPQATVPAPPQRPWVF